ncbi:D-alanyl-lipoteichoic acid biosynthesis protein DltD [Fictibacillus gelatini]|uniref:D-alanyl-lipoteichoic acid biosynthesis protein DltD n=1 Tax=Fictibacillus gelatini TaxID=225985 RepID=UPI0003F51016|nr:D-alanyl-lipoteichoic acid biosynthesis protein DltD [Fictibacillus gelatini]
MKKATFGPIIAAVLIFLILLWIPTSLLQSSVTNNEVKQAATSLDPNMFQGIALQKKMLQDKHYLPLYGSSELFRLDEYHPSNYFKVKHEGFIPFLVGRGGTQSLVQFLNLAATSNELKNRKVVFILSPQWFVKEGLNHRHFAPNFSKLQAYDLAFNDTIDPILKKRAAKRLLSFPFIRKDRDLAALLNGVVHGDPIDQAKKYAFTPYAYANYKVLTWRDFVQSRSIHARKAKVDPSLGSLSWEELIKRAEITGERSSRSNPYGITDRYYKRKIEPRINELKGYRAKEHYNHSPEYRDLQLILDLFRENHTQALFVSIPVNGKWYDFAGVPKERRQVYYKKVRHQIEKAGFPVADFSNHEYDKYFLKDTMHLGWKGWVYFDRAIAEFYHSKKPISKKY